MGFGVAHLSSTIRLGDVSAIDSFSAYGRALLVLHTRCAFRARTHDALKERSAGKLDIFTASGYAKETEER